MSDKANSVQKEIVVDAPVERAFRVFTDKMDSWWVREHHIGKAPMKTAILETRSNGRWYEVGTDGSECEWGRVLVWEPPRRVVLAWQINAQWQFDPSFMTEVEVTFTPVSQQSTRVVLEHRNLDRFGVKADEMRKSFDSPGGWGATLQRYAEAVRKSSGQPASDSVRRASVE